jgi:hypothetical protein
MYDIVSKPRIAIKAQALSNFMAKWTKMKTPSRERDRWNIGPSILMAPYNFKVKEGARILVTSPKGESFKCVIQMHFPASNNASEYEALLHGLRITTALGIRRLKVHRDSLLVVNQANKE